MESPGSSTGKISFPLINGRPINYDISAINACPGFRCGSPGYVKVNAASLCIKCMSMPMFTGLILLCLLGIRLGFNYYYISFVHQAINYFKKKESVLVFVTAYLLTIIGGLAVGGIAYLTDSLFPSTSGHRLAWRIQPLFVIYSLAILGGIELYRFYLKKNPVNMFGFISSVIIGCCLSVLATDRKATISSGVFSLCYGLAFATGTLFSETILKMIDFENSLKNSIHFMVAAERRTSAFIAYAYLGLAVVGFVFYSMANT